VVPRRLLGTMITHGYPRLTPASELDLAESLGAVVLEILPDWRSYPDPSELRKMVADRGLSIWSAHGSWGGQSIAASRVDLGSTDPAVWSESVDDLRRCVDWIEAAGGTHLVVHPGGLSFPADAALRRDGLARGLLKLADHAGGARVIVCVENMPPGVHPGSRMQDLHDLLVELDQPGLGLALDTGHAHISSSLSAETAAAGRLLATTHVHDNDGRQDTHLPPGSGTIDWDGWSDALDAIGYEGPVMLECIRHIRSNRSSYRTEVLAPLLRSRLSSDSGESKRS
jgi:sugar phosphate isomerase/epimerase